VESSHAPISDRADAHRLCLLCRNGEGIRHSIITLMLDNPDERPVLVAEDVKDLTPADCIAPTVTVRLDSKSVETEGFKTSR
jgi:hypothetical protein